jgi:hypothetical protein
MQQGGSLLGMAMDFEEALPANRKPRSPNITRDFDDMDKRIWNNYFSDNPRYPEHIFQRRFRVRRSRFIDIMAAVTEHEPRFRRLHDAAKKPGLTSLQKFVSVQRMLAYGTAADLFDESLGISEVSLLKYLKLFCKSMRAIYEDKYLGPPTPDRMKVILRENAARGFPGCIGSLDCMGWKWKVRANQY